MNINELKKIVKDLPERDVKAYLYHILLKVSFLEEKDYSRDKFLDDMKETYDYILNPLNRYADVPHEVNYKKVHILFGPLSLRQVLRELGTYKDEHIILFEDNFAIGPIAELHEEKGQITRYDWVKNCLHFSKEDLNDYKANIQRAINQINSIPKDVPIYIWVSENAHEQTGLLFARYLLRERANSIFIINTSKQYSELFKLKAKKYVPLNSGGIILEELKAIYKHIKENQVPLTHKEREQFENEWLSLTKNEETLRLWNKREIQSVTEDYYDEYIVTMAKKLLKKQKGFMKAARLIGEVYGRLDQYVGDDFLEYRLKKLIEDGIFEFEGSLDSMRFYSIKLR